MKQGECRQTNWGMAGKERKEQILAAELDFIRLDGAVPRAECRGGNWARVEVGFAV